MWGRLCAWMTESVATTTAPLHRTCLRHIPISAAPTTPHDVIVREWRPTYRQTREMGHGIFHIMRAMAGYCYQILTNQRRAMAGYCYQILTNQRRAMAGYCYQILTNQSFPPRMQCAVPSWGHKRHRTFISPHFLLWHVPDTTSIWEGILGA